MVIANPICYVICCWFNINNTLLRIQQFVAKQLKRKSETANRKQTKKGGRTNRREITKPIKAVQLIDNKKNTNGEITF